MGRNLAHGFSLQRRAICLVLALIVIGLGLGSRRFAGDLPPFVATYAGDTLWALAVLLALCVLAPRVPLKARAIFSILFAFAVEFSQLYHAPWIDAIRGTTLGALILGFGFLWSDLACYSVGVSIGALGEWAVLGNRRKESR